MRACNDNGNTVSIEYRGGSAVHLDSFIPVNDLLIEAENEAIKEVLRDFILTWESRTHCAEREATMEVFANLIREFWYD